MGSGLGGMPEEVILDTMVRFVARALELGMTSVKEVRIMLPDPEEAAKKWLQRIPQRKV